MRWSAGRSILLCGYATCLLALAGWLSLTRGGVAAADLPVLAMRAGPALAFAPADVEIVVLAKPDDANRYLAVSLGAADSRYARSSQRSLAGAAEPGQLALITYRDVPAGHYQIVAILYAADGTIRTQRSAAVRRLSTR